MPLSREALDAFLAQPHLCHFATVDDRGSIRVRPLWYLWRGGAFWLTTRMELRHTGRDLKNTNHATLSIASETKPYKAVVASGPIEVVGKDEALLRDISSRYGNEGAWLAMSLKEPDRVAFKLTPAKLLTWDYGQGDYGKQNKGESMRTRL